MKPETLIYVKKSIQPYIGLVRAYADTMLNDNLLIALSVQLHNICHDWSDCQGYSFEKDLAAVEAHITFIELLDKTIDYHFINWICSEVSMIYQGNLMSEEQDEEDDWSYEQAREEIYSN